MRSTLHGPNVVGSWKGYYWQKWSHSCNTALPCCYRFITLLLTVTTLRLIQCQWFFSNKIVLFLNEDKSREKLYISLTSFKAWSDWKYFCSVSSLSLITCIFSCSICDTASFSFDRHSSSLLLSSFCCLSWKLFQNCFLLLTVYNS